MLLQLATWQEVEAYLQTSRAIVIFVRPLVLPHILPEASKTSIVFAGGVSSAACRPSETAIRLNTVARSP